MFIITIVINSNAYLRVHTGALTLMYAKGLIQMW